MTMQNCLEFLRLTQDHVELLSNFFDVLRNSGDEKYFHPHPLTRQEAEFKCESKGLDLFYVLKGGESVIGYGILRGWDEGYEIPSLGIVTHPRYRGHGYGRILMNNLHAAAQWRGAEQIRLKVYRTNTSAKIFYESLGYYFTPFSDNEFLGVCSLVKSRC